MQSVISVDASGARLAVIVAGTGRPLLLVHGFPLDRAMWRHQLLAWEGWMCIAPDLRGAGGSDVPSGDYTMSRYADDLVTVLDAVEAPGAVCCGLSMGGYVLFELLRRHPERVLGLILCDTKSEADTPEAKQGRDELAGLARGEGMSAVATRLLPKLVGGSTRRAHGAVEDEVRQMVLRSPVTGVVGALAAMRDRAEATPWLSEIRVPSLVVGGAEDELTPPAVMRSMADRIPGARYVEIAGAGHVAPLERPEAVNAAVAEFLLGAAFR
jgi:pimeloyl-ACP methyl ester carboxylesterase